MIWTRIIRYRVICICIAIVLSSCVEPFDAEVPASQLDVLIIDGYINIGEGETRIVLSKVSKLDQEDAIRYEEGADVRIENDDSEVFLLNEKSHGIYTSGELNLPANKQYRLYIKLLNGKEYRSEFQTPKITPLIDSVHWEYKPDLLYVYVNTHDVTNESRYYRWSYREDWQIKSPFKADLKYDGDTIINNRPDPDMLAMHNCWKKAVSNKLIFGSSAVLVNDQLKFPVAAIPHGSEKTNVKYSIIVNQHTITEEEFNYLTLMNKNTTQTGSFFDPMPSQLFGNVKRINSDEPVIGYLGVYTTEQATLFILEAELPPGNSSQLHCESIEFEQTPENCMLYLGGINPPYIPYKKYNNDPNKPMVTAMPTKGCMDCRSDVTGKRPDHWYPDFEDADNDLP